MYFIDHDAEILVMNQKLDKARAEIAAARLQSESDRAPGIGSWLATFDAAVVRLSEGSARRHSLRTQQH